MMAHARAKRIAISSMADKIRSYEDDHFYYGPCCAGQSDMDASSYTSSPTRRTLERVDTTDSLYALPRHREQHLPTNSDAVTTPITKPQAASSPAEIDVDSHRLAAGTDLEISIPRSAPTPEPLEPELRLQQNQANFLRANHGGGFDPNPASSQAVKAVDKLLGIRRANTDLGNAVPTQPSNRVGALWQQAYLIHEYETRFRV